MSLSSDGAENNSTACTQAVLAGDSHTHTHTRSRRVIFSPLKTSDRRRSVRSSSRFGLRRRRRKILSPCVRPGVRVSERASRGVSRPRGSQRASGGYYSNIDPNKATLLFFVFLNGMRALCAGGGSRSTESRRAAREHQEISRRRPHGCQLVVDAYAEINEPNQTDRRTDGREFPSRALARSLSGSASGLAATPNSSWRQKTHPFPPRGVGWLVGAAPAKQTFFARSHRLGAAFLQQKQIILIAPHH